MKEYRLGDIITIKHGYAFDGEHIVQEDNGIVLVTPGNFRIGGGFQEEKCKFYSGEIPDGYVLSSGDFIVTMTDLSKTIDMLGYSALVPESDNRVYLHNQRIGLVSFKANDCFPGYIYFLMRTHPYQRFIANTSTGSTVHHTSPSKIYDYRFYAPSYEEQREIAERMFAYEKIIKNNQRQIKLLEEAAQRLYKEWFVDLRFPGHENTKITDGVPEGWRMAVLSEIASVNKESISKQYPYDYVDYIDIGAVSKGQINSVTRLSTKDAPGRAKRIAFDGDVLWGMVRPNLKSYALVFHPKETSVFSTGFAILHAEKVPFSFLYCHVTQDEFVSYLINCTNGAAYPAVKPSHFENAVLLVPTDMVLSKFHSLVGQMFRQAAILEQKNQQAIEARDRLLPKLMSGEIEV